MKDCTALFLRLLIIFSIFWIGCGGKEVDASYLDPSDTDTFDVTDDSYDEVIKLQQKNGVYILPVTINGYGMDMVFDSGASDISISSVEALFMIRQGKISQDDLLAPVDYIDANGKVSTGRKVRLREVEINGHKIKNVDAIIVNSAQAPLLLGISALKKFGDINFNPSTGWLTIK